MIPDFLKTLIENEYPQAIAQEIYEGYNGCRDTSFRLNTLKENYLDALKELDMLNIKYHKHDFIPNAYILNDQVNIETLNAFKDGLIYFQSLSSMLPPLYLNVKSKDTILDMCAAPGSKTSQLAQLGDNEVEIMACEVNKIRADRLKYNLNKLNCKKVSVMVIDATKLDDFFSFDKILLDAPCSGSGTFNVFDKTSKISFELVKNSSIIQTKLLRKASKILKKGSVMIYSTCSILKAENEDVVSKILKEGNLELVPISNDYNLDLLPSSIDGVIKVKPSKMYEGFFVAMLRKK